MGKVFGHYVILVQKNQRKTEERSALFLVAGSYRLILPTPTHQLSEADAYTEPVIDYLGDFLGLFPSPVTFP
jgi:hypothetical protein